MRTVMVLGVFDGIHEGHRALFSQARHLGDRLVAVTTHDHVVQELKGRSPYHPANARLADLAAEPDVDEALLGDPEVGAWAVLERVRPDVIALGYDQQAVRVNLVRYLADHDLRDIAIEIMEPHEPNRYKSSLLNPPREDGE